MPTEAFVKELKGVGCYRPIMFGEDSNTSCVDATMKTIARSLGIEFKPAKIPERELKLCPYCNSPDIDFETGGCPQCRSCGKKICEEDQVW